MFLVEHKVYSTSALEKRLRERRLSKIVLASNAELFQRYQSQRKSALQFRHFLGAVVDQQQNQFLTRLLTYFFG